MKLISDSFLIKKRNRKGHTSPGPKMGVGVRGVSWRESKGKETRALFFLLSQPHQGTLGCTGPGFMVALL
jgi:hypothetical protein